MFTPHIVLNCSRIGPIGGLRAFAENTMASLLALGYSVDAVLPNDINSPSETRKIATPAFLGSRAGGSLIKPAAWMAYSYFNFPVSREQRVLCTTHHVLPRHARQIVTVHDLRPYFYPDNAAQQLYFKLLLPRALKRCDGVLTVSETSRSLLVDIYGLEESRICVVPNAISVHPVPLASERACLADSLEPGYLLMVGATDAHKNADELLRMHRYWAPRFSVKIMAAPGNHRSFLESMATQLGIAHRVEFLSNVPPAALEALYAHCTALVYPSKMEGFGLPPLEAMAHGKPVIVTDIPIFREIYGDLPIFVNLTHEESWAAAFNQLCEPNPEYRQRAVAHAGSFTLEKMATALQSALHRFWG